MKNKAFRILVAVSLVCCMQAQTTDGTYTNFIRQVQLPDTGVQRDASVDTAGQQESPLEINPGGARFELHTVKADPFTSYLLDTRYVGSYVPIADITIETLDTESPTPRTRADKGYTVNVTMSGLRSGADDPEASKKVKFLHHIQSYGTDGNGVGIDRTQATLESQVNINSNGTHSFNYIITGVPASDPTKVRGEERFSIFSLDDYQAPSSQLASQTVQVWPMSTATLSGITDGELIKFTTPTLTLDVKDIYPEATVYARIYKGASNSNPTETSILPGSAVVVNESVPQDRLLTVDSWDSVIDDDGTYTIELLITTVFDTIKLADVTFEIDRTILVNGTVTTIE